MPMPITHIVFALSVLPLLPGKEKAAFLRGTSFPDIRYFFDYISREKTHIAKVSWQDVQQEPNSFKAGVLFHALVDQMNNPFIRSEYKEVVIPPEYKWYLLKFYQDLVLYDQVNDWHSIAALFDEVDIDVQEFDVSPADLIAWQQQIKTYLCPKPTIHYVATLLRRVPLSPTAIARGQGALARLLVDETVKMSIVNFYQKFLSNLVQK